MKNKKRIISAASVVLLLALWQLGSLLAGSSQLLPGPWEALKACAALLCRHTFLLVAGTTVLRALGAFAVAIVLGALLGVGGGLYESFDAFLRPWVVAVRSTPIVAFVLIAIIFLSSDGVPLFIGILTMLPIVYLNVVEGMRAVDGKLVEMARLYGVRGGRLLREVYRPAIRPFVLSGVSTAIGMGWRAIVVGEVLSTPQWGIGTAMTTAQGFLQVDILLAWTLITVMVGAAFEGVIRLVEKRTAPRGRRVGKVSHEERLVEEEMPANGKFDIVLEDISKSYGDGVKVLDHVSRRFEGGKVNRITGPSGSGKTTMLNIISGLLKPDEGHVMAVDSLAQGIDGPVSGIERMQIGYAFQEPRLLAWKTVLENVEFVLPRNISKADCRRIAIHALELVEMDPYADQLPHSLSGGMAQRVNLARAIAPILGPQNRSLRPTSRATEPTPYLLLLDEPYSNLDPELRARIQTRLQALWATHPTTILLVSH